MTMNSQYLRSNPQANYFSWLEQMTSPSMRRYYESMYGDMYNRYQGALGAQARTSDAMPSVDFTKFLSGVDPLQDYYGRPAYQRGSNPSIAAPMARWLMY